jgi:hypothetical protein
LVSDAFAVGCIIFYVSAPKCKPNFISKVVISYAVIGKLYRAMTD